MARSLEQQKIKDEYHYELILKIEDELTSDDFIAVKHLARAYLPPRLLENINNFSNLIDELARKDLQVIWKNGGYTKLIDIFTTATLPNVVKLIKQYEDKIKNAPVTAVVALSSCYTYDDSGTGVGGMTETPQIPTDSSQLEVNIKNSAGQFLEYAIKAALIGQKEQIIISDNKGNETECELCWKLRMHSWEIVYDVTITYPTPTEQAKVTIKGRKSRGGAIVDALCRITGQIYGAGVTVKFGDKTCTTT